MVARAVDRVLWLLAALAPLALLAPVGAQRSVEPIVPRVVARERVVEDLQYAEGHAKEPRRNRLDLYLPDPAADADGAKPPLVMFVHGGMWTGGKKDSWGGLARSFVQRGIACACINTQLFPFATPAAMAADCGRALAWLHEHAAEHGYDGDRLFVMGHSSGGHLVTLLALDERRLEAAGVPRPALRGVIALSGVHEVRTRHVALDKVFGTDAAVRADCSPVVHASAGDPPVLAVWGEQDIPGIALTGRLLRAALHDAGVPAPGGVLPGRNHVDYLWSLAAPGDALFERLVAFVEQPPVPAAPPAPPSIATRRVELAMPAGAPAVATLPADGIARTTLVWIVVDDADRRAAERLATALAPHGVVVVAAPCAPRTADAVAAIWRALRGASATAVVPAPQYLGGAGAASLVVADAPLERRDGLVGRVLAGPPFGDRELGADAAATIERLRATPSSVMILQGGDDPPQRRADTVTVGVTMHHADVDVDFVEVVGATTAEALQRLGRESDVLLPLLRAFLLR